MKKTIFLASMLVLASASSLHAERIVYNYDNLNRLCTVNYQNQAAVQYAYDAAHNLEQCNIWSGENYFRAFMLYLTQTGRVLNYVEYLMSDIVPVQPEPESIFNS